MQTTFSTERLLLYIISENDADFILKLVNTKGWLAFIGDRNIHSKKDAINYIKKIKALPDLYYWVVKIKQRDIPIGIISFLKRNYLDHFDIGFAFLPEFNGCGYAFEAAKRVLDHVSEQPAYETVLATTIAENPGSIKLLNKLGLHFEKEMQIENNIIHIYRYSKKLSGLPVIQQVT